MGIRREDCDLCITRLVGSHVVTMLVSDSGGWSWRFFFELSSTIVVK